MKMKRNLRKRIGRWSVHLKPDEGCIYVYEARVLRGHYDLIVSMPSYCRKCMHPCVSEEECEYHLEDEVLDRTLAVSIYRPVRRRPIAGLSDLLGEHIRFLKHYAEYAKPIAAAMIICLEGKVFPDFSIDDIDVIIPIPRHPEELKIDEETGQPYNQAELLAAHVARGINKPLLADVLMKTEKFSMHNKPKRERIRLARHGYSIRPGMEFKVEGESVLLIDDTRTTGATLDACARRLKEAGAKEVYAYVAGRDIWVGVVRRCLGQT